MTLWVPLVVAVFVVVGYVVVMRAFIQRSREADSQVDHSKIRPWVDDED